MPPDRPAAQARLSGDRGTGLIASSAGVLVFLCFLLFATQLLVGLHASSAVAAVAYDGATRVAAARVDQQDPAARRSAQAHAETHMRALLGRTGETCTFDWSGSTGDEIVLRVSASAPRFMMAGLGGPLVTDTIERTVRIRVERPR